MMTEKWGEQIREEAQKLDKKGKWADGTWKPMLQPERKDAGREQRGRDAGGRSQGWAGGGGRGTGAGGGQGGVDVDVEKDAMQAAKRWRMKDTLEVI